MIFAVVGKLIRAGLARLGVHLPQRRRTLVERLWEARSAPPEEDGRGRR